MKVKKKSNQRKNNGNEDTVADFSETEKQRLKNDIQQLKTLILQVERQDTDITKFSDVTNVKELLLPPTPEHRTNANVQNLNIIFRKELYTYAGFYCVKFTKTEFVFEFTSSDQGEKFSVQILKKDDKGTLGSWVMPMSVDMEKILDKTPIDNTSAVLPFLKNCKNHIDCYRERKRQYEQLKDEISDKNNCEIDANLGFTLIILRLLGVYNKKKDSYVDLTIQLSYKSNETRPSNIGVDWNMKKDPSPLQENEMKSYAKYLRNQRILKGFRNMIDNPHPVFDWTTEEYVNSPLELNNSSESEEEEIMITARRKRKKLLTKRHKNRELKERWKKRQRQTTISTRSQNSEGTDEENEYPSVESHHSVRTRSSARSLMDPETSEKSKGPPKPQKSSKITVTKSAKSKPGRKLRQTTITFSTEKTNPLKDQNSAKVPVPTATEIIATEHLSLESSSPASTKSLRSTSKKKLTDKTEKRLEIVQAKAVTPRIKKSAIPVAKRPPINVSSTKKSAIPLAKNRMIGKLSAKKDGAKKVNRAATSTPLRSTVQSKMKLKAMSEMALSPIAAVNETKK